ncbi:MAG: hypothetical protein HYT80_05575 [Euryarchaeota archaeon]|nr:hypothetical protein [Euryarchaeota archaeon]
MVLAATVFVLVSDIGSQGSKSAPNIVFSQDEVGDGISVTSAGAGANWNRLSIKVPFAGEAYFDPDGSTFTTITLSASTFQTVTTSDIPVKPSDKICLRSTSGAQSNVRLEMRDDVASAAVGQGWVFSTVGTSAKAAC